MMNAGTVLLLGVILLEFVYLTQGKVYRKQDICGYLPASTNVTGWASKLLIDAKAVRKVETFKNWAGDKSLKDFCTMDKKVKKNFRLHAAIAVLKLYVTALNDKYSEAKKLVQSYGCDCQCEREPQGLTKIGNVGDTLCWFFHSVYNITPSNGVYGISFDSENVDKINITNTFKMVENFSRCIVGNSEKKWGHCARNVLKVCGRKGKGKGRGQRGEKNKNKERRNKKKGSH